MASGSQVCRPSWADLPMAPTNSSRQRRLERRQVHAEEMDAHLGHLGALGEDVGIADRAAQHPHGEDAEGEAEIADAVDDEAP